MNFQILVKININRPDMLIMQNIVRHASTCATKYCDTILQTLF